MQTFVCLIVRLMNVHQPILFLLDFVEIMSLDLGFQSIYSVNGSIIFMKTKFCTLFNVLTLDISFQFGELCITWRSWCYVFMHQELRRFMVWSLEICASGRIVKLQAAGLGT